MSKQLVKALKIVLPLGLGIYLIWSVLHDLTDENKQQIIEAFQTANYGWVLLSLIPALLSHASRAYRWKYTMEPLGMKPRFLNSFFTVMVGYFVNLGIPRSGEVARVALMSRYEKMPFTKLMGTVIGERVTDLLILLSIMATVLYMQLDIVGDYLNKQVQNSDSIFLKPWVLLGGAVLGLAFAFLFLRWLRSSTNTVARKILGLVEGIIDGVKSIWQMPRRWAFLGHTFFIWAMYILMFYVCFFALPGTRLIPLSGVMAGFVMGGLAITLTPGGIGAYPIAIQIVLALYGLDEPTGLAFGWIVWTVQTLMLVAVGALGLLILPIYNRNSTPNHVTT